AGEAVPKQARRIDARPLDDHVAVRDGMQGAKYVCLATTIEPCYCAILTDVGRVVFALRRRRPIRTEATFGLVRLRVLQNLNDRFPGILVFLAQGGLLVLPVEGQGWTQLT